MLLMGVAVGGCGASPDATTIGPAAACHAWERLNARPPKDAMGAGERLAEKSPPPVARMLRTLMDDAAHGRDFEGDTLRLNRYCASR